jgi:nucleotide-binding universal stress UspA family protein
VTYSTLMACLRPGETNAGLLAVVGELAERFEASVVGLATRQPMQHMFSGNLVPEALIEQENAAFQDHADALEAQFSAALKGRARDLEWRAKMAVGPLSDYVAGESRCADLVVAQVEAGSVFTRPSVHLDVGDLVMKAGRPVLVVPAGADRLKLDCVVVGWKETAESRRAVSDALPLLKAAGAVVVTSVAGESQSIETRSRLEDVVAWLKRHGVAAEAVAADSSSDEARGLTQIALDRGAELIVAGAFGQSPLREWAFGGVTRDLLLRSERFTLLSH